MPVYAIAFEQKLIVGVATSVCQTNYGLVSEDWLRRLIDMGVMYAWFHTYRVIGPNPALELALTPIKSAVCEVSW